MTNAVTNYRVLFRDGKFASWSPKAFQVSTNPLYNGTLLVLEAEGYISILGTSRIGDYFS